MGASGPAAQSTRPPAPEASTAAHSTLICTWRRFPSRSQQSAQNRQGDVTRLSAACPTTSSLTGAESAYSCRVNTPCGTSTTHRVFRRSDGGDRGGQVSDDRAPVRGPSDCHQSSAHRRFFHSLDPLAASPTPDTSLSGSANFYQHRRGGHSNPELWPERAALQWVGVAIASLLSALRFLCDCIRETARNGTHLWIGRFSGFLKRSPSIRIIPLCLLKDSQIKQRNA